MKKYFFITCIFFLCLLLQYWYLINRNTFEKSISNSYEYEIEGVVDSLTIDGIIDSAYIFLSAQRIISSLPILDVDTWLDRGLGLHWDSKFYLNRLSEYNNFLLDKKMSPYGGFILYDYNFSHFKNSKEAKEYLFLLREQYKQIIKVETENKKYYVIIYPFISTDCAVNVGLSYCRASELFISDIPLTDLPTKYYLDKIDFFEKQVRVYYENGFNTFFSPCVDYRDGINIDSLGFYAEMVSKIFHKKKMIPTLKHFGYSGKVDTHKGRYVDHRKLKTLHSNDLAPYYKVNNLGFPFLLMPTHFILATIDSTEICTKSKKIVDFINKEFGNAVTISDSVDMLGYSKTDNLAKRILDNTCDIVIARPSNIFPLKGINEIYDGIMKNSISKNQKEKLAKILRLKKYYGLMEIYEFQK